MCHFFLVFFSPLSFAITSLGEERAILSAFSYVCSICACLALSVSSSFWGLGRAAVCDCGTPWTFLLPFFVCGPWVPRFKGNGYTFRRVKFSQNGLPLLKTDLLCEERNCYRRKQILSFIVDPVQYFQSLTNWNSLITWLVCTQQWLRWLQTYWIYILCRGCSLVSND